uniref:Vomeronasal type-1 receptor n=1 Tax=Felis catus TaxID=9685 RepID=A0ABI8A2R0_FELCA
MTAIDLVMVMIFLLQIIVGLLGNFYLLYHYLLLYLTGWGFRSTDLILKHLTIANSLVILSKGVPHMMAVWGLKEFLNDIRSKFVFYVHRVCRNVSIGTVCLLSLFQMIIISPRDSRWGWLKVKASKYLGSSNILCWILNIMFSIIIPMYITGKWSHQNVTKAKSYDYCYSRGPDYIAQLLHLASVLFHDGFCLGLMIWANGSMVLILHRHKQQVQYIHSNNLSTRSSPESTATQSILILVITFVFLCILSFIFHNCSVIFDNPSWWLMNTTTLITACFPTVSPYILMSHDSRLSRFCFVKKRNTKLLKFTINV